MFNGELFCNVSQTIEKILKNLGHSLMENSDRATPPSPLLLWRYWGFRTLGFYGSAVTIWQHGNGKEGLGKSVRAKSQEVKLGRHRSS